MDSRQVRPSAASEAAASLRSSDPWRATAAARWARADTSQETHGRNQGRGRLSVLCWSGLVTFTLLGTSQIQASETAYQVKDINQARQHSGSNPCNFQLANGLVYFFGNLSPGCNYFGNAVYSTDGTAAGTSTVWSDPSPDAYVIDGHVFDGDYYYQSSVSNAGTYTYTSTLRRTDGTPQGSVDLHSTMSGYGMSKLAAIGNRQIFGDQYINPGGGTEMWSTDGTPGGTVRLLRYDGNQTTIFSSQEYFSPTKFGGALLFTATNYTTNHVDLWSTDGTPGGTVKLLSADNVGYIDLGPDDFLQLGSSQLFITYDSNTFGQSVWSTDGTPGGTVKLLDIAPGTNLNLHGYNTPPAQLGGAILFSTTSYDTSSGQIWRTDGTLAGTALLAQLDGQFPGSFYPAQGQVYFTTNESTTYALSLWRTDATAPGTLELAADLGSEPFTKGSRAYFTKQDPAVGMEPWTSDGTIAGTGLLKDIYPGMDNSDPKNPVPQSSNPMSFLNLNGTVYFTATDGTNGLQFWTSDGTADGTVAVTASMPQDVGYGLNFTIQSGALIFTANQSRELWKFVPGGDAELLKDVSEGTAGSIGEVFNTAACGGCQPPPVLHGKLLFRAHNELRGCELWATDGTPVGTVPLEILPGPEPAPVNGFYCPTSNFLTTIGDTLYYQADDGTHGLELYRTDATPAGTGLVKDVYPGPGHGWPSLNYPEDSILAYNGKLVFQGVSPGEGPEPWISDGTEAGTHLVKDLVLGNDSSNISSLSAMKDKVVFSADDGVHGDEPWVSNGTAAGTRLLRNIVPEGPPRPLPDNSGVNYGSYPGGFFRFGKGLIFGAATSADCGLGSLFRTDGTPAGTLLVKAFPYPNCNAYFNPEGFTRLNDSVYFKGLDADHGRELWRTDATSQGTFVVADIDASDYYGRPASSEPGPIIQWKNGLILGATTQADGTELWKFDERRQQAQQIKDINPGSAASSPYGFAPLGSKLYFVANDDQGSGLFRTNGAAGGTVLVKRVCPGCYVGPPGSNPYGPLTRVGNKLFFSGTNDGNGTELWVSDGTTAGTHMVVDLYPGDTYPNSSYPVNLTSFKDRLYFSTETPDKGRELWKSDGTAGGTVLVNDINPGSDSSHPGGSSYQAQSGFLIANGWLYFSADDGVNGQELWRTDGTAAGTVLVEDILPGPDSSAPASLTLAGERLYFTAQDSVPGDRVHGRELWALRPDPPRQP